MSSSEETVKTTKPGITMFTTESTEFTKKKQHNDSCDSSVTSVYSVVKFVTRSINVNDQNHPVAAERL